MSYTILKKVEKTVGFPEVRCFNENTKSYCITWKISNFSSYSSSKEHFRLRSPLFSVPNAYKCKWYLSLELEASKTENNYVLPLRLVLDRESNCKEASVSSSLFISNSNSQHTCGSSYGNIFNFVAKSENGNSSGNMCAVNTRNNYNYGLSNNAVTIVCEMMVKSVVPETKPLSVDFGTLLKNKLYPDIELSVGEKKYPAHKAILAARSSVFASIFANKLTKNETELRIEDINENLMEEILRYIYTDDVEKLDLLAKDLWLVAGKYNLKGLQIMCEDMLMTILSSSNVLDVLAFAVTNNFDGLKSKAMDFIWNLGTEVMKTSAWQLLAECDHELLKQICENGFRFVEKLK